MTKTENLVLEHLRLIRKELTELTEGQTGVQVETQPSGNRWPGSPRRSMPGTTASAPSRPASSDWSGVSS